MKADIPHHLTNNIPTNAEHLIGRDAELEAIAVHLAQNRATVLVNGIGGVGKTSVATKFMALRGPEYEHLAWLTVSGSLAETFVNHTVLKESLHIAQEVKELVEARNIADAFALVFKKLNELGKTLVVIDNANELADLVEHKNLFDHCPCHVLITSRNRPQEWTAVVPVDALPAAEAVQLFKKIAPPQGPEVTDQAIEDMLSKLYFHALLIELVAKAVASAGLSFEELQAMIETQFIHHDTLREEIIPTGRHGDSLPDNAKRANIEDYIRLIFNQVHGLNDKSKDILRCMALLPLATPIGREDLKKHLAIWNIEDIAHPLTMLVERGWIDKEQAAGQKPQYKMHPLIADVVVVHLEVNADFAEVYTKRVAELIYYENTNPEHNLIEINKHKSLAERLSDLFWEENREEASDLLGNLGNLEDNFGIYQKAAAYHERALVIDETVFDQNHATVAVRQSNLANVYRTLGRYDEAAGLLETAMRNIVEKLGSDHAHVAIYQSSLALAYQNLERYEEAIDLLESALKSNLKNYDKDHPNVAINQSNLALVYHKLSRHAEAVELLESALKSDLKNFGKDHPNVAIRQLNLAAVYIKTDRKPEAKALLQAAYQNFLQNFGQTHPHTINIQKWFPHAEE